MFCRFNEYSKNGCGASGHHQQHKPRVPKLRRMSAAAFNFLSNNIAPKWLSDKRVDNSGNEWTDDPKHRLSLNDDHNHGYGYGSTYNGATINHTLHNNYGYNPNNTHHHHPQDVHNNHNRGHAGYNIGRPLATYVPVQQVVSSSAPEYNSRQRRLSSPDPVLAHCANTIAVADFLMTLQRSLDTETSGCTLQPVVHPSSNRQTFCNGGRLPPERRSPLFTMFQDRRASSSAESWQYSSLTSTVSSTATGTEDAAAVHTAIPMLPAPSGINTINTVTKLYYNCKII